MQPYGPNANGGWAYPQGYGPPVGYPPPATAVGGPPLVYGNQPGQPVWVPNSRGRGRGRGASGNTGTPNLVTRVKAEIQVARPGQVLELARFAASQLSSRSPVLYQQFVTGLVGGAPQASPPVEEKSTRAMIVADRKQRWKALCVQDDEVQYWQQIQDKFKSEHGTNCEVDSLVAEYDDVDVRKYLRGKRRRESLLKDAKLAREGSSFVPLEGDEEDSNLGDHSLSRTAQADHSSHVLSVSNEQAMSFFMSLLTQVASLQPGQQATALSPTGSNTGGLVAGNRTSSSEMKEGDKKPPPGPKGPPQGAPKADGGK